jgi:cytidyltransferase-like protein
LMKMHNLPEMDHVTPSHPASSSWRVALFPGTFDPFTIGHESLVRRGLELVDEIVISIGVNEAKKALFALEKRVEMISSLYRNEPRVKVRSYSSLSIICNVLSSFTPSGERRDCPDENWEISNSETISDSVVLDIIIRCYWSIDYPRIIPFGTNALTSCP